MYTVIVEKFCISDIEDFELCMASIIRDWQNSSKGQWVIKNSVRCPLIEQYLDQNSLNWSIIVSAKFTASTMTEYLLRWA
jgi:hypothetical protein